MKRVSISLLIFLIGLSLLAQNSKWWSLGSNGGIDWIPGKPAGHIDHIEMSGLQVPCLKSKPVD